jgi:PAS domain S-box-containing protein
VERPPYPDPSIGTRKKRRLSDSGCPVSRKHCRAKPGSTAGYNTPDVSSHNEAAARLAAIVDSSDDAIVGLDLGGNITSWNPAAERLYGYTVQEAVGQPITLIVPDDMYGAEEAVLARVAKGEIVQHFETLRRHRDGTLLPISLTVSPICTETGEIIGASKIARDIRGRQVAERAARRLAAIVESSDDAIISKDLNGIVMSWNAAAARMFGYSAADMIGQSIRLLIPADRQAEEDDVLGHIRRGEKVEHFETIRRRKNGTLLPISLTVSPILSEDGTVIGASKIARDISDRKRAEAERARLLAIAQRQVATTRKLNQVGGTVAATLDRGEIVSAVTNAGTEVTGAEFGAFFYNATDPVSGETYLLYTLAGAPKDAFAKFPNPRATAIFGPTFRGEGVIRLADVTQDPRYGQNAPFHGMPPGHLPVRSYLAVPVKNRTGAVLGGLFFGHSVSDMFTEEHTELATGIAVWASMALENARLYEESQDVSRLKDDFLATLSHELRTPLNAILGYARMIRSGLVRGDNQERAIETIERNATSLTQIVEDVLDVSRIISGKIRLNVQPVDLPAVIQHALDAVAPAADARGVRIETDIDPHASPVSGDPDRIQQVIWNLASNSVKFTGRGGRVQVRLARVDSQVEIVVSDDGIGIAPDFLPHVFERFRQADSGTTRERGGLGLGLAISRNLVEMHGGTIHAASAGAGKGTTIRVTLPSLVRPEVHAGGQFAAHRHASERQMLIPDLLGIRVLAVDDDPDALRMVREILEAAGAQVSSAGSADEALQSLNSLRPDVLVADLGLPRMDGFELIAEIRRRPDPAVRDLPAAALTAYARSEDRSRALKAGFQIHLSKPIDPGDLMAAVAALAGRTGARSHAAP